MGATDSSDEGTAGSPEAWGDGDSVTAESATSSAETSGSGPANSPAGVSSIVMAAPHLTLRAVIPRTCRAKRLRYCTSARFGTDPR